MLSLQELVNMTAALLLSSSAKVRNSAFFICCCCYFLYNSRNSCQQGPDQISLLIVAEILLCGANGHILLLSPAVQVIFLFFFK